jgi:glutathione S-transferase
MVSVPWWFLGLTGESENGLSGWLDSRLSHVEAILCERKWLVENRFTAADLIMTDVLRVPAIRARGDRPASEAYVERQLARPSFKKAHADQLAHFAAADERRTRPT